MLQAAAELDRSKVVAPVRPRLFGSFVEYLGRCVYTGSMSRATPPPTTGGSAATWSSWSASWA